MARFRGSTFDDTTIGMDSDNLLPKEQRFLNLSAMAGGGRSNPAPIEAETEISTDNGQETVSWA
jgi:hypothetical protein